MRKPPSSRARHTIRTAMIMPMTTATMGPIAMTMLMAIPICILIRIPMAATATIITTITGQVRSIMTILTIMTISTIIITTPITTIRMPTTPPARRSIVAAALPVCMSLA